MKKFWDFPIKVFLDSPALLPLQNGKSQVITECIVTYTKMEQKNSSARNILLQRMQLMGLGQNPLRQNPIGHNPRWTKSPRTKSPRTKSGDFVLGDFVLGGFCPRGFSPRGILS